MTPEFKRAVNIVLKHEGGYSDDANDPGNWTGGKVNDGELVGTKYGISAASYPHMDIKNLNPEKAKALYWRDYWVANKCDQLPPAVAVVYFDACVNQGPRLAAVALQRALGVKADGIVGPVTIAAARVRDQYELVGQMVSERAWQYSATKNFQRFGKGWFNRLGDVAREAFGR